MDAYVYQAALFCEDCALEIRDKNETGGAITFEDMKENSEHWPQGPYSDGGGEADCPQHCDGCGVFLENPLTGDGNEYVAQAIVDHLMDKRGNLDVLREWIARYGLAVHVIDCPSDKVEVIPWR